MEKTPTFRSKSQLFFLNRQQRLTDYCAELGKILNNPQKYEIVNNVIEMTRFKEPFVVFQYQDNTGIKEKQTEKFEVFGEIITEEKLGHYDDIVSDHWAKKLTLTFDMNYTNSDGLFYKVIIYVVSRPGVANAKSEAERVKPVS